MTPIQLWRWMTMWPLCMTAKRTLAKSWKLTSWTLTFPFSHTKEICQYLQNSSYLKYQSTLGFKRKHLMHYSSPKRRQARKKGKVGFRRNSTGDDSSDARSLGQEKLIFLNCSINLHSDIFYSILLFI